MNETLTETKTLTPDQLLTAAHLAAAYGHTWGGAVLDALNREEADVVALAASGIGEIRCLSLETEEGPCGYGIVEPTVDEAGNIVHETGTGRVRWTVTPDGTATVEVRRPSDWSRDPEVVLSWYVDIARYEIEPTAARTQIRNTTPYYRRHAFALLQALEAAAGSELWSLWGAEISTEVLGDALPDSIVVGEAEAPHYGVFSNEDPASPRYKTVAEMVADNRMWSGQTLYSTEPVSLNVAANFRDVVFSTRAGSEFIVEIFEVNRK